MFAFVKKLFGKSETAPSRTEPRYRATTPFPPKPAPARPTTPAVPAATAVAPVAAPQPAPAQPAPEPRVPAPPRKTVPLIPEAEYSKETVDLPLKPLWPKLAPELTQSAVYSPKGDTFLKLPLNLVLAHLASGGMKIPFSQFRQFSPEGLFNGQAPGETLEINIPISDILRQLKPDQLPRRSDQKKVDVPEDIEPIFGTKAAKKGLIRIATDKPKAGAPLPAPAVPPSPATIPNAQPVAPVPTTARSAAVPEPAMKTPSELASEPLRAPNLDPSLATLRSTPPPPKPSAHDQQFLTINLMDVTAYWAGRGKTKLEKLYRHTIEIPVGTIEAALKRGKVEFLWREVRCWVRLTAGTALPTIEDDMVVDFPLSFVAPRFFELQHKTAPRKRIEVSEEIPDVFVRHAPATSVPPAPATSVPPAPATSVPPAPATSVPPAPAAPVTPVPAVPVLAAAKEAAAAAREPREFGEIFGQPEKKDWSLGEVSQRTSSLPGVAGAIIATSDGLLVGGQWPGAQSETVAAFAPQIYSRMSSYTKELHLGEPNHFTLLIENVPLQIFKSADSYFTVLGRAGENLPAKELNAIATRLAETLTAPSN